jgi:hypothetical protein
MHLSLLYTQRQIRFLTLTSGLRGVAIQRDLDQHGTSSTDTLLWDV